MTYELRQALIDDADPHYRTRLHDSTYDVCINNLEICFLFNYSHLTCIRKLSHHSNILILHYSGQRNHEKVT